MATKVLLQDNNDNKILPITRGELVLDSSGVIAFHSTEFEGTNKIPGLMSPSDKSKLDSLEDTHWTSQVFIGSVNTQKSNSTTNGNTYIKLFEENILRNQYKIKGSGNTTVTSDSSGHITINSPTTLSWNNITNRPDEYTPEAHTHTTNQINSLANYVISNQATAITTTDTLNAALGKLEYKANLGKSAYDWYQSVTGEDDDYIINKWEEIVNFIYDLDEETNILDKFVTTDTDQNIYGVKIFTESITSPKFITEDGTSAQFVKGDGSLDDEDYLSASNYTNYINVDIFPGLGGVKSVSIEDDEVIIEYVDADSENLTIPYAIKSSCVLDYNNSTQYPIHIGWAGASLSSSQASYFAVYGETSSGDTCIKNMSATEAKKFIGLGNVRNTAFYKRVVTVNNQSWNMAGTDNSAAFSIFAPTNAGTSGQILASTSGIPTWRTVGSGLQMDDSSINLPKTGVEADTFGPQVDVTGDNEVEIAIPNFTVDEYGRITAASNIIYTAMNWFPELLIWNNGTDKGPVGILKGVGMNDVIFPAIPSATIEQSGIVTTDVQIFSGQKHFVNGIHIGNEIPDEASDLNNLKISFGDAASEAWIGEMEDQVLYLHGNIGLYLENERFSLKFTDSGYFYGADINLGMSGAEFYCLFAKNIGLSSSRCEYGYFSNKVYATNGFFQDSDERLKNIVEPVKVNLDDLTKLRKVFYTWKKDIDNTKQLGMIAQDVYELYPELVTIDKETGYMSLAYDKLSVISLEAIDELYKIVKDLKLENEKLRSELKILNY